MVAVPNTSNTPYKLEVRETGKYSKEVFVDMRNIISVLSSWK